MLGCSEERNGDLAWHFRRGYSASYYQWSDTDWTWVLYVVLPNICIWTLILSIVMTACELITRRREARKP